MQHFLNTEKNFSNICTERWQLQENIESSLAIANCEFVLRIAMQNPSDREFIFYHNTNSMCYKNVAVLNFHFLIHQSFFETVVELHYFVP